MDCHEFLSRYSEYDDSLLTAGELARFRVHLSDCASCERYDRVLRKGRMLARQIPPIPPGAEFAPRLNHRLWQQRTRRRPGIAGVPGGAATALAGVTVVLVSLWAVTLMDHEGDVMADATLPVVELAPRHATAPQPPTVARAGLSNARVLLPTAEAPPREWTVRRVDQPASGTYSPLVTGPPTYRVSGAVQTSALISTGN